MNTDAWQVLAPAIETAPIAIVAVNHELRYCLWNAAAVELTGIPTEDAIGRRPGELLGAHVGNPVEQACADILASGTAPEHILTYRWPGPKTPDVRVHRSAVRDANGQVIGAIVHIVDVTDELRNADALDRSEKLIRAMFDQAPVGIALVTPAAVLRANPTLERLLGYSAAELARRAPHTLAADPADAERLRAQIEAAIARGSAFEAEIAHTRADGSRITLLVQCAARPLAPSETACVVSYVDVTERLAAESAWRESEQRFRLFADHIDSFIYFADPAAHRVLYFNARQYQDVYGGDPEELERDVDSVWRYVHPDDQAKLTAMRAQADEDGYGEIDFRILHPFKGERSAHLRIYPTRVADGRTLTFGIVDDVTEERLSEAQRLNELTEQRDKVVREVHHRIKNNLQGVAGLLQQTARVRPQLAGMLTEIVGQIQAIAQVHGLQMRARDAIPLSDMLNNVLGNAAALHDAKLPVSFSGNALTRMRLPEQEAVPVALVVTELATNALKYRAPGSEARATLACTDEGAELVIINHGSLPPGFSFAALARSTSGLGLVKSLLPRRGGSLTITQEGEEVVVNMRLIAPAIGFDDTAPA